MNCINRKILLFIVTFMSAMFVREALAQSTIDPNAQVVYLRKSCLLQGTTYQDNCFETTAALTSWLWGSGGTVRANQPSASDRVHVEAGPGDFGPFECSGQLSDSPRKGYVSVEGAGREATRFIRTTAVTTGINGANLNGTCRGAIHVEHCDGMEFTNVGADGPSGAFWLGAGKGVWNNVDMVGESGICPGQPYTTSTGWYDLPDGATTKSTQYFFGSRMWVKSGAVLAFALDTLNSDMWFYGSDIAALIDASTPAGATAIFVNNSAEVHIFGGTVRVAGSNVSMQNATSAVGVYMQGGVFDMHGGTISLNVSGTTNQWSLIGFYVSPDDSPVFVNTPGTAFTFGNGANTTDKRIVMVSSTYSANTKIDSPFLWQPSDTAPQGGDNSLHGQDMFVDTSANGTSEAHLMVRDDTCSGSGGAWRDMASGQCRTQ